MAGVSPYGALNKWLRDHQRANTAHKVLHYQGDVLIAYCGRKFPAGEASDQGGVVLCPKCVTMSAQRKEDKVQALKGKYAKTRQPRQLVPSEVSGITSSGAKDNK